jgi:hypothetical protein
MAANHPGLVRLLGDDVEITRSFWLVTHRDMTKLARIQAVSGLIQKQAATVLPVS